MEQHTAYPTIKVLFRQIIHLKLLALGVALGAALGTIGVAHADCLALQQTAAAAQQTGNQARLTEVYAAALTDSTCDNAYRRLLGRAIVRGLEIKVIQSVQTGTPLARFEGELADSRQYATSWRVSAWLGDIADDRHDYAAASTAYQDALNAIRDDVATPKAPDTAIIADIFHKAEQARLLADRFVPAQATRAGEPGGLNAISFRGFTPTKVALPIEFVYDSVAFTPKGQAAVDDLVGMLRAQAPTTITLAGHTDERGAFDYNMTLSRRRADAVATYLRHNGFAGDITVVGKGPTEPMALDDPGKYTPEQIYQINRRVELLR